MTAAAKILGVFPDTIYKYLKRYPKARAAFDAYREELIDEAEERLANIMRDSPQELEFRTIQFILSRMGRARGWGNDPDTDTPVGGGGVGPRVVYIVAPDGSYTDERGNVRSVHDEPILLKAAEVEKAEVVDEEEG